MAQPVQEIVINVGRRRDGMFFQLSPKSQLWLENQFPHLHVPGKVFIGFDTASSLDDMKVDIWRQVILMLTGITEQELEKMARVRFYDPVTMSDLRNVG